MIALGVVMNNLINTPHISGVQWIKLL